MRAEAFFGLFQGTVSDLSRRIRFVKSKESRLNVASFMWFSTVQRFALVEEPFANGEPPSLLIRANQVSILPPHSPSDMFSTTLRSDLREGFARLAGKRQGLVSKTAKPRQQTGRQQRTYLPWR